MLGQKNLPAAVLVVCVLAKVLILSFQPALAVKGLFSRSLTIGTSEPSATTSYDFQFDITVGAQLGSIRFEFCSNNPIPFISCTPPAGMDMSGATLAGQSGETGFSVFPGSATANTVLLSRIPSAASPQTATYDFDGVVNPDTAGSYFVRLYTHSTNDGSGPAVEEAGIAFAIVDLFDVTAEVPPYLLFCVGLTIPANDCSNASGNLIDFGILNNSAPNAARSQMIGGTNGVGGLAISVLGTTMTSGINSIPALSSPGISIPSTGQFGINLRDNSSPNIGSEPVGPGTTAPFGNYALVNQFVFNSGDVVASSPISTDFKTLTVSYVVNVPEDQAPGIYAATLSFVATATF